MASTAQEGEPAPAKGSASDIIEVVHDDTDDDDDDDDEESSVDQEQLDEYREMVENLGNFPDKVQINSLTMVAEDFSETKKGATAIYNVIKNRLLTASREKLLPLVYLVDSIIKNAKGQFVSVITTDLRWMPTVYKKLSEPESKKMQRVWKTWKDGNILDENSLNAIEQECLSLSVGSMQASVVAGISRAKDGTLILPKALRQEMQNLLDDMQTDTMEMDKMSLERLADKEPQLFASVKQTAQESLIVIASTSNHHQQATSSGSGGGGGGGGGGFLLSSSRGGSNDENADVTRSRIPSFIMETRSRTTMEHARAWKQVLSEQQKSGAAAAGGFEIDSVLNKAIQPLKQRILEDTAEGRYTQEESMEMTQYLAAVSATTSLLEALQQQENTKTSQSKYFNPNSFLFSSDNAKKSSNRAGKDGHHSRGGTGAKSSGITLVDAKDFTNDGIKKKVPAVVGSLYEGLPFVSSSDGRRFQSQLDLSRHLDALFKRTQLEKSMTRTQERDWYMDFAIWTGETTTQQGDASMAVSGENEPGVGGSGSGGTTDDGYDPATSTMPADESRDRCVICGLNFKMEFDNEDGMYKYKNCREIEVLNDDEVALSHSDLQLVHVTCWRGLGSPVVLTMDQALQETLHH